jgi:hypothetical protein
MKFAPQNWNDILSLVLLFGFPAFWVFLLASGVAENILLLLLGATIGFVGQVVTYYFRKSPPDVGITTTTTTTDTTTRGKTTTMGGPGETEGSVTNIER